MLTPQDPLCSFLATTERETRIVVLRMSFPACRAARMPCIARRGVPTRDGWALCIAASTAGGEQTSPSFRAVPALGRATTERAVRTVASRAQSTVGFASATSRAVPRAAARTGSRVTCSVATLREVHGCLRRDSSRVVPTPGRLTAGTGLSFRARRQAECVSATEGAARSPWPRGTAIRTTYSAAVFAVWIAEAAARERPTGAFFARISGDSSLEGPGSGRGQGLAGAVSLTGPPPEGIRAGPISRKLQP